MIMLIILRKGVTKLCAASEKLAELMVEFEAVAKELDEVLEDLKWRKPDVEAEELKLRKLRRQAKNDPMVNVAVQAETVRVLRAILDDKIALADALEKRMILLRDQIKALEKETLEEREVGESGEALR